MTAHHPAAGILRGQLRARCQSMLGVDSAAPTSSIEYGLHLVPVDRADPGARVVDDADGQVGGHQQTEHVLQERIGRHPWDR